MFISKNCFNFALVIELERHIEVLLLSNDCVIVPDLGGFMAHHVEAKYSEEEQTFLPPLRTLGFNSQLKINDSLLVQSYIEAYDISYPEALQRVEDEVNELKMHLKTKGSYTMNDIGTLAVNESENYVFTPCEAGLLTPSLYGLGAFCASPLTTKTSIHKAPSNKPETEIETAKILAMSPTVDETEGSDEDVVKIKFSWIRNSIAIAAVLLAIFLLALPTGKTEMMTRTISNLNNNILFGMMSKDTNTSKIEIKKTDIQKTLVKVDTILKNDTSRSAKVQKKDSVRNGYCIVLASCISKKNAAIFIESLQKKGYPESEVYIHNNMTRVVYGNFETQQDAYNMLRKIHKDKALQDAWVYKYN